MKRFLRIFLPALMLASVATPLIGEGVASAATDSTTTALTLPGSITYGSEEAATFSATITTSRRCRHLGSNDGSVTFDYNTSTVICTDATISWTFQGAPNFDYVGTASCSPTSNTEIPAGTYSNNVFASFSGYIKTGGGGYTYSASTSSPGQSMTVTNPTVTPTVTFTNGTGAVPNQTATVTLPASTS